MRTFKLRWLRIESFRSFTSATEVEFSDSGGLKFLTGRNEVEPRLGANGAGKTSLWDALFWCCYGVSILGKRASDLVSWGASRPRVAALIEIDGEQHHIERIGCPERIWYAAPGDTNPSDCDQEQINRILSLSRARFQQSVIFGQNMPMFLDLDIPGRGRLLDEALDLGFWHRAADQAATKYKAETDVVSEEQRLLAFDRGKLAALPDPAELQSLCDAWSDAEEARIEALLAEVEQLDQSCSQQRATLAQARADHAALLRPDAVEVTEWRDQLNQLIQARAEVRGHQQAIASGTTIFTKHARACPTCLQAISEDYNAAKIAEFDATQVSNTKLFDGYNRKIINAERKIIALEAHNRDLQAALDRSKAHGAQLAVTLAADEKQLDRMLVKVEAEAANPPTNPYRKQIDEATAKLADYNRAIAAREANVTAHQGRALLYDYWRSGFKRVRLYIVKRILLQLELDTANAASLLGIGDWRIRFATEVANKAGDLRHGVQVQIIAPSARGAATEGSGGERQRARLAINMGLSTMIQRMAGVSYQFEIWDEPSNALSDEGIDDLLDCLRYRAQITGKSIWLTDHRTFSYNFDEVWTAIKREAGTTVEQTLEEAEV